jgi:peptide methionine sulfoxide reductase MsrA
VRSSVGYTGGLEPNPTYKGVCGKANTHTEALRLEIDTSTLTYEELVQHLVDDPRVRAPFADAPPPRPQYKTAVWAQDEAQRKTARRVLAAGGKETIPVLARSEWYEAEDWHQHFLGEFKDFPDEEDEDDESNPWSSAHGPGTWMGL